MMQAGVSTAQWESGNSGTAFPFEDDSLPDGFPVGVIVDACVVVPDGMDGDVCVSCIHVGPTIASVMITVGGRPALSKSVLISSMVPFSPVPLEPMVDGVSGIVSFGDLSKEDRITVRSEATLSNSVIVRPSIGRLSSFVRRDTGASASGFVGLDLQEGLSVAIDDGEVESVLRFSAGDSIREDVTIPCLKYDRDNSMPVPVRTINGVAPDKDGRIAIVFAKSASEVPA